jgi:dTMP kinase
VEDEILPALARGDLVISDRYDLSSLTYQSVTSDEPTAVSWLTELNRYAVRPDLTIVLDVEPEVAERRRKGRGEAAEIFEVPELQRQLARAYARAESFAAEDRVLHLDANAEPDVVTEAIASALEIAIASA